MSTTENGYVESHGTAAVFPERVQSAVLVTHGRVNPVLRLRKGEPCVVRPDLRNRAVPALDATGRRPQTQGDAWHRTSSVRRDFWSRLPRVTWETPSAQRCIAHAAGACLVLSEWRRCDQHWRRCQLKLPHMKE